MQRRSMLFNLLGAAGLVGLLSGCGSGGGATDGSAAVNTAPVINTAPPLVGALSKPYSYDVNATDADGDTLTYSLVGNLVTPVPFGMTIDPTTGVISWTPMAQEGDNLVTVQVSDGSQTASQSFTVTVAVAPTPVAPVFITPVTLPRALVNVAYSTTVIAADGNNDPITYSVTAASTGPTIDSTSGVITWTPDATQIGNQTVTVVATDGVLSVSQDFTISVETATAVTAVTFGFNDLTRGGFNVTQPGLWTNIGPNAFSTASGSAIIARGDLEVILDSQGRPRFNSPEFTFLGVTLINRGTTDVTFFVVGYNVSHGLTTFSYSVTVNGKQQVRVENSLLDNSNRPMNVPIERLEVNGNSPFPPDFGVSCLGVGTSGSAPACP